MLIALAILLVVSCLVVLCAFALCVSASQADDKLASEGKLPWGS